MHLNVLILSKNLTGIFEDITLSSLKKNHSYWFEDSQILIRPKSKRSNVYSWRIIPNRSYEFYRCPRVDITDQPVITQIYEEAVYAAR